MILTVVGVTGSMSGPASPASCYLLQAEGTDSLGLPHTYSVVFDLGPGSFGQIWNYTDPTKLDAVVLSHLHADHCSDIVSMQVHRRWHPRGELGPIPVYAPKGVKDRVRGLDGFSPRDDFSSEFEFHHIKQGREFNVGPLQIKPFAAWHSVPAFSFRVTGPGKNGQAVFTYSGDSDECDTLVQAATNSDLFLSECGFTREDEIRGIHMSGDRAGRVAQNSGTSKLVLTHIQPWTDQEVPLKEAKTTWRGELEIARSGMRFEL